MRALGKTYPATYPIILTGKNSSDEKASTEQRTRKPPMSVDNKLSNHAWIIDFNSLLSVLIEQRCLKGDGPFNWEAE